MLHCVKVFEKVSHPLVAPQIEILFKKIPQATLHYLIADDLCSIPDYYGTLLYLSQKSVIRILTIL